MPASPSASGAAIVELLAREHGGARRALRRCDGRCRDAATGTEVLVDA
jgi:hypothetical protein